MGSLYWQDNVFILRWPPVNIGSGSGLLPDGMTPFEPYQKLHHLLHGGNEKWEIWSVGHTFFECFKANHYIQKKSRLCIWTKIVWYTPNQGATLWLSKCATYTDLWVKIENFTSFYGNGGSSGFYKSNFLIVYGWHCYYVGSWASWLCHNRYPWKVYGIASNLRMMTSSDGNMFHVAGPLCGEFTGDRWIPHTKANDMELWCFLWSAPEQTIEYTIQMLVIWDAITLIMTVTENSNRGQWYCHHAYYDMTVMEMNKVTDAH